MKAFDDWWENSGIQERTLPYVDDEGAAYWTWKAALEWVRGKVENYTPEDIAYFIGEELGENE